MSKFEMGYFLEKNAKYVYASDSHLSFSACLYDHRISYKNLTLYTLHHHYKMFTAVLIGKFHDSEAQIIEIELSHIRFHPPPSSPSRKKIFTLIAKPRIHQTL